MAKSLFRKYSGPAPPGIYFNTLAPSVSEALSIPSAVVYAGVKIRGVTPSLQYSFSPLGPNCCPTRKI
jgi:hypothetical protein